MIFESAQNADGDTYMGMFQQVMRNASLEDMRDEVQSACEYFESFKVPNDQVWTRLNNATYTITQIVARLVGRVREAEDKAERAGDDRAHAEAEKMRERARSFLDAAGSERRTAELLAGVLRAHAVTMDPYHVVDGQLVRKSDGKPVTP